MPLSTTPENAVELGNVTISPVHKYGKILLAAGIGLLVIIALTTFAKTKTL